MDGQLAHALATATWGDRWLTHDGVDADSFEADNTAAALLADVTFVDPVGAELRSLAAWLAELRRQGVTRVRLVLGDDAPGYALYAHGPVPTVWVPQWGIGNFGDPRGKIWSARYTGILLDHELPSAGITLEDATDALQAAIGRCRQFTTRAALPAWDETFAQAAQLLRAGSPAVPGYGDLVPPGTPLGVRRLLAAAVTTEISGPMTAWPSLRFDDPALRAEYEACAQQLDLATRQAFVAATAGEHRGRLTHPKSPSSPAFVQRWLPRRRRATTPPDAPTAESTPQAS